MRIQVTVKWAINATLLMVKANCETLAIPYPKKSSNRQLSRLSILGLLLQDSIKIREIDREVWWIIASSKIEVMEIIQTSKQSNVSSLIKVRTVHTLRDALLLMEILSCVWILSKTNNRWTMANNSFRIMVNFLCQHTKICMVVCNRLTKIWIP